MPRRIWIIPSKKEEIIDRHTLILNDLKGKKRRREETTAMVLEIEQAKYVATQLALEDAQSNYCSEIVWGVPLSLSHLIDLTSLPMAFEEPELPISVSRDILSEMDDLKLRIKKLEDTNAG